MKLSSVAFLLQLAAALSYLSLYFLGLGWPEVLASALVFVLRLVSGASVLVTSKRTYAVALAASIVGIGYSILVMVTEASVVPVICIALELGAFVLTYQAIRKALGTKQPSPLDMPVYG